MEAWKEGKDFKEALIKDKEITKAIKPYQINKCFELNYYLRNIPKVFKRAILGQK